MATAGGEEDGLRAALIDWVTELGDLTVFALRVCLWLPRRPARGTVVPVFYSVGVGSVPVVCVTGLGIVGGARVTVNVFHVDAHHYWSNANGYVGVWDLFAGMVKAMTFGATIALIACYRGFHSDAGAEGVGRAATRSFVTSFIVILV